jgi:ubiquinone/menaquinone biosynthesis C-methylase UbiE
VFCNVEGARRHLFWAQNPRSLFQDASIYAQSIFWILWDGGVGIAAAFLAQQYGCHVVAVDITPRMLVRARERAERKGVTALTDFRVADMHALPFKDGRFDAVLAESVICFSSDKENALAEMIRVVKSGGYVAFTEATWRIPPPPDMAR